MWELARLGVPAVVGAIAPIETRLLEGLAERGLYERVGWFRDHDAASLGAILARVADDHGARAAMARVGAALIDGQGAARVVRIMQETGDA